MNSRIVTQFHLLMTKFHDGVLEMGLNFSLASFLKICIYICPSLSQPGFPCKGKMTLTLRWDHSKMENMTGKSKNKWRCMKTAARYHYIPTKWLRSKELTRPSDHEDMDQLEFFCVAVGNVNWFNHFGKTIWSYLMKLNIFLSCGPAFPVISIFPREMHTYIYPKTCGKYW